MIVGVGVDLVDVDRMARSLGRRWGRRLVERVFTDDEIAVCERTAYPAEGFAARFAAKEALAKALGTGFTRGVTPRAIRVHGKEREAPRITLTAGALKVAQSLNVNRIHVSLSHTKSTACAYVVIERDRSPS